MQLVFVRFDTFTGEIWIAADKIVSIYLDPNQEGTAVISTVGGDDYRVKGNGMDRIKKAMEEVQ